MYCRTITGRPASTAHQPALRRKSRLNWAVERRPRAANTNKDEFDEWLARIVCYAFSLPPTPFIRQMNRATADTAQDAALAEGLAPLMGWVKRLVDHVIQDRMGHADLEFAWVDLRPADPAEQAKLLDLYVRDGIYTVNEARDILGLDPVRGGDQAMVYGTTGAVPLAAVPQPPAAARPGKAAHPGVSTRLARTNTLLKDDFDPDEPRVAAGNPDGGEWTADGSAGTELIDDPGDAQPPGHAAAGAGPAAVAATATAAEPAGGDSGSRNEETAVLTDVVYQGTYHDQVVAELADHWGSQGAKVLTSVALTARNGATARADLIAIDPSAGGLTLFEVKTGTDPQYTDPQRVVYPMAQIGDHVYSPDPKISQLGFAPGEWLPPMRFYTIYKQNAQSPYLWIEHSSPLLP
jgi:hypothetical protein